MIMLAKRIPLSVDAGEGAGESINPDPIVPTVGAN
jgi:hypothetical protein